MAALVSAAAPAARAEGPVQAPGPEGFQGLYLLQFNRWGDLINPDERDLAIVQMRGNPALHRVIVISYGWSNEGESSYATYRRMIADIAQSAETVDAPGRAAVIAVGWDSSLTGLRKLLNDLLPLPFLADTIAYVPDKILFPVSFWSKAAMADRIGFGGLRSTLNQIFAEAFPDPEKHPEIVLIGHSFGTRVVSGLLQDEMGLFPVRGEPFAAADHVVGAVLLQPAAVLANLHEHAEYPILVTQSRHDHANGLLFPLANSVLNTYSFTTLEGLFRHTVFEYVEETVGATVGTVGGAVGGVTDVVTAPLPWPRRAPAREKEEEKPRPSRALYLARRSLAELVSIPTAIAITLASMPVNYGYTQLHGLLTRPLDHVMDTLAQLPLVEVGVWGLDRALGHEIFWGDRGKGFFELGALHESVGRLVTPRIYPRGLPGVYTASELDEFAHDADGCRLPVCKGVFVIDASRQVRHGAFGDLENPWIDFTVGWLDPIGAHADYRSPEVVHFMTRLRDATTRSGLDGR
jgi:hypothetical protein